MALSADNRYVSQVVAGKRKANDAAPAPAPSRHNKGQTEQVLKTIAGYDSALTLSAAIQTALLVWLLPALAYLGLGGIGMSGHRAVLYQAADSIAFGVLLLAIFSVGLLTHWFGRVRANVPMLASNPSIGALKAASVSLKLLAVAAPLAIAARFVPNYDHFFRPALVLIGAAAFSGVVLFFVKAARMLWATSVSPANPDGALPRFALAGIVAWFGAIGLWVVQDAVLQIVPWSVNHSIVMVLSGLTMAVAAVAGGRFIGQVGRRQEARLLAIGESLGVQTSLTPVSTEAIQQAWNESESLIGYDFH